MNLNIVFTEAQIVPVGASSGWFLGPFDMRLGVFAAWYDTMLQVQLVYFLPQIQIQALLQVLCFLLVRSYGFSVVMYRCELDHKEGWALKDWWFQTVVLEKILESPLDTTEIKPVNPKGNPPWIFIGRTDAEALILWPPDAKSRLIGKDPDAGKDWGQDEKGTTEDELVGWHHWLDGHEFEQTPRDSEGQGSLACCGPRGHKETRLKDWTATTKNFKATTQHWEWLLL